MKKDQKKLKEKARRKNYQRRKAVLKIMREHNRVKYRSLPGIIGMVFPYQETPITYTEALYKLQTGRLPVREGVKETMTDAQTQRLADLQALETLAEEERPVLDALIALRDATANLEQVRQTVTEDPIAVAQKAVDDAQAAYETAEAAFQATQNTGATTEPANPGDAGATPDGTPSNVPPVDATTNEADGSSDASQA